MNQSLLQEIETELAQFGEEVLIKIESGVSAFDEKYGPYIKAFLVQLFKIETKDALDAAIASLKSGSSIPQVAAAVSAAVTSSLVANAEAAAAQQLEAAKDAPISPKVAESATEQ